MKKIKFLMIAMMAILATVSFTACSSDDDEPSNVVRYQNAVNDAVSKGKQNSKVILLVALVPLGSRHTMLSTPLSRHIRMHSLATTFSFLSLLPFASTVQQQARMWLHAISIHLTTGSRLSPK